jgi:hypothetical protein
MTPLIVDCLAISTPSNAISSSSCNEGGLALTVLGGCVDFSAMVNCHRERVVFIINFSTKK